MAFKLTDAKYRARLFELRCEDDDGEVLVVAIFSYRTTTRLSKQ
jgi:hypothetical protein